MVGPVGTVGEAERLAREEPLDAAVLDVDLRGERVFPAADALAARGVPFLFLSGFDWRILPDRFRDRLLLAKPHAPEQLPAALAGAMGERRTGEGWRTGEETGDRPECR